MIQCWEWTTGLKEIDMPKFDLIREPWVPVLRADGTTQELGLREVLHQAHSLLAIRDPMPIVEFGLYRLLVALAMDIFAVKGINALGRLLGQGRFDPGKVDAYFAQWEDRFDLFHPVHPFLQTTGMGEEDPKPLAGLIPSIPSGTNATFFHHARQDDFGVCPAVAGRLLTSIAPFMTAGGAGLSPSINGAPPWYVLVVGQDLFETLCLNICAVPLAQAAGTAPPAWRSDKSVEPGRRTEASLLEALTWQPRRAQLLPGGTGVCALSQRETPILVQTMKFTAGVSCDFSWRDPNVSYRINEKGRLPLRPQEGREVWRDTGPLALLQEGDYESRERKVRFERPAIVDQFGQLIEQEILNPDKTLDLQVFGMRTDLKMKVFEWQRERLSLPAPLVWESRFHCEAQEAMDRADRAAYLILQGIKKAYPREGKGNKNALNTLIAAAQRQFWVSLREEYEGSLLPALAQLQPAGTGEGLSALRDQWNNRLRQRAAAAFDSAVGDLDTDAEALKRLVAARGFFHHVLKNLFAPEEEKTTRKQRKKQPASK
jgi:CRISPR system Cascade subunit CasA